MHVQKMYFILNSVALCDEHLTINVSIQESRNMIIFVALALTFFLITKAFEIDFYVTQTYIHVG